MHKFTSMMLTCALCLAAVLTANAQSMVKVKKHSAPLKEEGAWIYLGEAQMQDGWVTPGLGATIGDELNPADYAFNVKVYESAETPHLYKLISPYTSEAFPFLSKNENTEAHDILIDATRADFVRVEAQESGFVNVDKSRVNFSDPFYIGNAGCYFNEEEGYDEDEIIEYGFNSTFKDGVITITSPRFGKAPKGAAFGYNWQSEQPTIIILPSEQPAEQWKAAGQAMFTDGFVSPGYSMDGEAYSWKVDVEESTTTAGLYRLVNPYTTEGSPLADMSADNAPAYVRIDASDPDIVVIEPQYSGFKAYSGDELISFYIGNDAGFYVASGVTKEMLKGSDSMAGKLDKMVDGVITIGTPLFGKDAYNEFGYQWTLGGETVNTAARIDFNNTDGIKGVSDAQTEGRTLYYNLQGQRVNLLQEGQVYVQKKGNSTTKIFK